MLLLLLPTLLWGLGDHTVAAAPENVLRDGDIVFQTSRSSQSEAIRLATKSRFTHMGLVYIRGRRPWVFEASRRVTLTPFRDWVARGDGGHVVVKRLRERERTLTREAFRKMWSFGKRFMGRPYDPQFRWDDDRLYCSELVYKVYQQGAGIQVGRLQRAGDFNLTSVVVQAKIRERFSRTTFSADEPVISPQSIAEDSKLVTVYER